MKQQITETEENLFFGEKYAQVSVVSDLKAAYSVTMNIFRKIFFSF